MNPSALIALLTLASPPAARAPVEDPEPEPEAAEPTEPTEPTEPVPKKAKKYSFKFRLRVIGGARLQQREPAIDLEGLPVGQARHKGSLDLRQARLRFDAKYRGILRVRMSLEASDFLDKPEPGYVLRDAWANAKIRPGFQIKIGRFKRPYSRLELRGMGSLPVLGRGLYNDYAVEDLGYGDRAVGGGVWGKLKLERPGAHEVTWAVTASNAAFSGAPHGVDLHARLTWDPTSWLSLGASGAYKSVQDPLADEATCRNNWTRSSECRRRVFGAGGDIAFEVKGLYASVEADLAQDWRFADTSPWMLGAIAYATYDFEVGSSFRLQPVVLGEFVDTNLSFAESEAARAVVGFNVLWKKRLRIMPQASFVRPLAPVTAFNNFVESQTYGLWIAVQI